MVKLQKFTKEDAGFIIENFPGYFKTPTIEFVENQIEKWAKSLAFCIVYNDEKVGIITLSEKEGKKLSWGIIIKEEYRRRGIAKEAFEIISVVAKEKGYSMVISSCAKENVASANLHEKVGFSLVKEEINSAGREMLRWEKEL